MKKPEKSLAANSRQIDGEHYKGVENYQPWDYIQAHNLTYLEGNIIKYVTRHRKKNKLRDLLKAQHYIEKLIEVEYGDVVEN